MHILSLFMCDKQSSKFCKNNKIGMIALRAAGWYLRNLNFGEINPKLRLETQEPSIFTLEILFLLI